MGESIAATHVEVRHYPLGAYTDGQWVILDNRRNRVAARGQAADLEAAKAAARGAYAALEARRARKASAP